MASALDVAKFILKKRGPMSAMKLQKLVYYSQAWSLVWDEKPLFSERIKAWANGPVVPQLYQAHKGRFEVESNHIPGNVDTIDSDGRGTIEGVLKFYGDKPAQWLSDLTHRERPWRKARGSRGPDDSGGDEITHEAMSEYYGSLKK
jgi:uncharacterized phage-associated protein